MESKVTEEAIMYKCFQVVLSEVSGIVICQIKFWDSVKRIDSII